MALLSIDESQYKMNRHEHKQDLCKEARGKGDNRELGVRVINTQDEPM